MGLMAKMADSNYVQNIGGIVIRRLSFNTLISVKPEQVCF
ncbi:hypothetical protein HMPREF0208_04217 [Citrobacter koseri]|nr:hypothetical protein HMPREF3220_00741 [Citrobacter koseri]KXA04730.1 hypothetical protein HMPREF3207_01203 [Citrobacter koseri]KXB40521.1 hypothetical protein HMPREF0208_04217 [Citrobacter koseri]